MLSQTFHLKPRAFPFLANPRSVLLDSIRNHLKSFTRNDRGFGLGSGLKAGIRTVHSHILDILLRDVQVLEEQQAQHDAPLDRQVLDDRFDLLCREDGRGGGVTLHDRDRRIR